MAHPTVNINDLPENVRKQLKEENKMNRGDLIRIQIYPQDLAYLLDIGDIADMHVDFENNIQVLRITHLPKKESEFKTVKIAPSKKPVSTVKRKQTPQPQPRQQRSVIDADEVQGMGGKLMQMGKTWMAKKDKPGFMKDAGF